MSERQLHLFEPARPLLERFGNEFFRAVPARPGVYIMCGEEQRVLYIGQSHNLRVRLASYKNARPDRAPRKVIRLVHAVRTIVWEECPTAQSAILKENQLLRTHRPRFNRMNTWPRAYRFIEVQMEGDCLTLGLVSEAQGKGKFFGAFKGATLPTAALMRLLWMAVHQPASACDFPAGLCGERLATRYSFDFKTANSRISFGQWIRALENFLSGASDKLLALLLEAMPATDCVFQKNLQTADLETLAVFYLRGPRRIHALRAREKLPPLIVQEELDDLLVVSKDAGNNSCVNTSD